MRKVIHYLKDYQIKHFDGKLYSAIGVFLVVCFSFNYYFDFEDSVLDQLHGSWWYWAGMFVWMTFPYVGVTVILQLFGKVNAMQNKSYWAMILIGFLIHGADRSFYGYQWMQEVFDHVDYRFIAKCVKWSSSLILAVFPLILVYLAIDRENKTAPYYGLALRQFDAKPYFYLLGMAIILIGIGSFFSDIQAYYPRYLRAGGANFASKHEIPVWIAVLIYQLSYGSDFVSVEVFFRGFLIHAFAKMLGGYAVLPMIASYAFLHFGKPLTEAVSSVFGGYILGIISYYSKNVWGGIIIHIGIAWAMELFGYLQHLF